MDLIIDKRTAIKYNLLMEILSKDLFFKFLDQNNLMIVSKSNDFLSAHEYYCMPSDKDKQEALLEDIVDCLNGLFFSYEDLAMSLRNVFEKYDAIKRSY